MRKRLAVGLVAAAVAIGLVVARRHELLRVCIGGIASLASGYTVRIGGQAIGWHEMALGDVVVSRGGYPLLDAKRIDLRYSLRDLLPGSAHRYGLVGVDIRQAQLTIFKFPDGRWNFAIPSGGGRAVPQPARYNAVPIRFALRMHDAGLELREPGAYDPSAKDVRVVHFNVDASIDSAALTQYRASGVFAQRTAMPFTIDGRVDAVRGYAMHRARAARFPLRALANYFADTPTVRILRGGARNFDARLYALDVRPNEPSTYHASLSVDIDGGRIGLSALNAPVDDVRGRLQVVDNVCFLSRIDARLAGIPLRLTGGIFDLTGALTGQAQLRLGIYGTGDLRDLRHAFAFTRDQPVAGKIALGVLVEGPIVNPLIVANATAAHAAYRALPFDALRAGVIYRDQVVALAPLRARYAGMDVGMQGALDIGKQLHSHVALHVTGTAQSMPYLDEMLGTEPIVVDAAADGDDLRFRVRGAIVSARGIGRLAALLALDENGTAEIAPFWFHTQRGDFDGGYALDRPDGTSGFWARASGLQMRAVTAKTFPGIDLPQIPAVDSRSIDFSVAGGGAGSHVAIAGAFTGAGARIAGVDFDRVTAGFAGTLANAQIDLLHARGPWGRFDGAGDFSTQAFVARGRYSGTFEGLQPFLGSAIPGHGRLAGTAAIAVEPSRILVQGERLEMRGATLHGVPIERASITLAVEGSRLRVYSAHARAGGGDLVAAGEFSAGAGGGGRLSLVAKALNVRALRGIGLPLQSGRLWASGDLSAGTPFPTFDGGVTVTHGRMQQYPLSGNGEVRLAGDAVDLHRMVGALGTTYTLVDGRLGGLASGVPQYDLYADVPAGSVASALRTLGFPTYRMRGSFNARLRVGGRGLVPNVSGPVAIPAGEINGLPFIDGAAELAADGSGVSATDGRVLVGTTALAFAGGVYGRSGDVHVVAPAARLEDFDNYFDTGDTLGGSGSIRIAAAASRGRVNSTGDVDVRALRYRRLPFGDTRAVWSSQGPRVAGTLAVGSPEGRLHARGSLQLVPSTHLVTMLTRSSYDLSGNLSGLDLDLWVPALGFTDLPIAGRVSGEATVDGRYPDLSLRGSASIAGGRLGPLALQRADASLHSQGSRILLDSAQLETAGLVASASGSFGLRPTAPLDLSVHAATAELPRLLHRFAHVDLPIDGAFESTLDVRGTYAAPTFAAGIDGTNVIAYGVPMASIFGEVHLRGRTLVISNAGATLGKGSASLAGSVPLQLSPLRLGPGNEPVDFDLDVVDLDPAIFDAALGNQTKLGGTIDGHVGLSGTIAEPIVIGHASLANGSYVSTLERVPIAHANAAVTFSRTSASLQRLSANLGSGTVEGSGLIAFDEGPGRHGLSLALQARAKGAQLDLPAFGTGTLNAALSIDKNPESRAVLGGKLELTDATLPFSAFIAAAGSGKGAGALPLPPLGFDLTASAGKNVRVRGNGYGAGLDIGATGSVHLGGTLAAPTLAGDFTSTGGTLTYFDRAFRVQEGSVHFSPSDGLLPTIHAVGRTSVVNPDPDRARNPYGSADIAITVNGPIQGLKIGFTTNPPGYTREQVIAMLSPFGGFISGIGFSNTSAFAVQTPGGFTPYGAVSPVPQGVYQQRNGTITVGQEAFNILNAQFTAGLLAPVENALGAGLGLSSVNLTLGYYGNVGVTATRMLGKGVSAVYATTFGIPQVQSFGLQVQSSADTTASLNFFYQTGPQQIFQTPVTAVGVNGQALVGQPLLGTSGFSFQFKRFF